MTVFSPEVRIRPGSGPATLLPSLPPLSVYVHVPWCVRKCPYCDFNSHERAGAVPEAAYLDALRADLEAALPIVWGRRVHSVFIGGGTPSLFTPDGIDRLLTDIRARLPLEPDFLARASRLPSWAAPGGEFAGLRSFKNAEVAELLRTHIVSDAGRDRHYSIFALNIENSEYQVVIRFLRGAAGADSPTAVVGFLVAPTIAAGLLAVSLHRGPQRRGPLRCAASSWPGRARWSARTPSNACRPARSSDSQVWWTDW